LTLQVPEFSLDFLSIPVLFFVFLFTDQPAKATVRERELWHELSTPYTKANVCQLRGRRGQNALSHESMIELVEAPSAKSKRLVVHHKGRFACYIRPIQVTGSSSASGEDRRRKLLTEFRQSMVFVFYNIFLLQAQVMMPALLSASPGKLRGNGRPRDPGNGACIERRGKVPEQPPLLL